jgi:hypothetical protein
MCAAGLNNYVMYTGSEGVYTHTVAYERDAGCPVCSAGALVTAPRGATLQEVRVLLAAAAVYGLRGAQQPTPPPKNNTKTLTLPYTQTK